MTETKYLKPLSPREIRALDDQNLIAHIEVWAQALATAQEQGGLAIEEAALRFRDEKKAGKDD